MKSVEANDASAMSVLANHYYNGLIGLQQDEEKEIELWKQTMGLGSSQAQFHLGIIMKGRIIEREIPL